MRALVTGAAGFIGAAVAKRLIDTGYAVLGVDNFNDYYDGTLKEARYQECCRKGVAFRRVDLSDVDQIRNELTRYKFDIVVHLAAQAGVRYSLENPSAYLNSNIVGFNNLLEVVREYSLTKRLVYASSSSVYGSRSLNAFRTSDPQNSPESIYAATKQANEAIASAYAKSFDLNICGLRFFTVYGPWGRPDMAPWIFTENILRGDPITLYNNGEMYRDFTYIDDISKGVCDIVQQFDKVHGHEIYNLGRGCPVYMKMFVETIERLTGKKAVVNSDVCPRGDVPVTYADIEPTTQKFGYRPRINFEKGLKQFISWYKRHYNI